MYVSTKTYGHNLGLSCCFRQWRATHSHCRFLHGYALQVRLEFEAAQLDARNWVMDFGALKPIKAMLETAFDHKTIIAADDPLLDHFRGLEELGALELTVLPDVGCEKFAEWIAHEVRQWLVSNGYHPRVMLRRVEVCEHGANSAIYE